MKRVIFVAPTQYGYNMDYFKYCELLSTNYEVHYLGIDCGRVLRESSNVKVHNVKRGKIGGRLSLLYNLFKLNRHHSFDKIFIYAVPLSSLALLFTEHDNVILDIRTSAISGKIKSKIINKLISIESHFFKTTSVISFGVADFMKIKSKRIRLLPLGADVGLLTDRDNQRVSLLYVGTFYDRHIENTVLGVKKLLSFEDNLTPQNFNYYIIGFGSAKEVSLVKNAIEANGLQKYVFFEGEKRFEQLMPYYEMCNVGVSYIPLTDYYDCQPPTKTFEYLLNSMAVIATPTTENNAIINETNGVILKGDSPDDFALGVKELIEKLPSLDFRDIHLQSLKYTWENILKENLIHIIEE